MLYAFVDAAYLDGRDPVELARMLRDGGADLVQWRAKGWDAAEVRRVAEKLVGVLEPAGVGLVINDHPEIAREVGASWCHLGQEDFFDAGYRTRQDLLGMAESPRLGLSTHAPEQALKAMKAGADYIAIGPVWPTGTKPGAKPVTLEYVRWAAEHSDRPWFAIGGIDESNLDQVLEAGATRICVVSAILRAPDVTVACQKLKNRLVSFLSSSSEP